MRTVQILPQFEDGFTTGWYVSIACNMSNEWLKPHKIMYHMTGDQPHSSLVISLADVKTGVFQRGEPGS